MRTFKVKDPLMYDNEMRPENYYDKTNYANYIVSFIIIVYMSYPVYSMTKGFKTT